MVGDRKYTGFANLQSQTITALGVSFVDAQREFVTKSVDMSSF
jgi:hypothetical protein